MRPTHTLKAPALWIGSDHAFDLHEVYLCFRSPVFDRPQAADIELFITADSRYKLWINGEYVTRGPARCWPNHQAVDRIDIAPLLRDTGNVIAVQVYQPGYSHFSYVHRGAAGILAWLVADDNPFLITDAEWRTRRDQSYRSLVDRVSIYGSGVEERDLHRAEAWQQPAYDDGYWARSLIVSPSTGGFWTGLHERAVPTPAERDHDMRLVEMRRGPTDAQRDIHQRLKTGWYASSREAQIVNADFWIILNLSANESAYLLYDLGRNYTCQGWVEVEGASGEEELLVSYAEKFRDGDLVISDPQTYCRVRLTDRFRLRPGNQTAQGFTMRGGRYLLVQVVGPTGHRLRFRPHVTVAEYPLEVTRPLECTDPVLNDVVSICETTLRACMQETFVDCCWRESSQWLGDTLPQALLLASMNDDVRPLRQALVMAAQGAYPDGVLPSILPGEVHAYAVVDYNFSWVEMLRVYWDLTGDRDFLLSLWSTLDRLLDRFHADLSDDGLIRSQPGRRLFLDWAPLSRSEPSALYNFRYLLALQIASSLADTLGIESKVAVEWRKRATGLATALRAHFLVDGAWYDDLERTTFSQHCAAFALLTGCADIDTLPALLDALATRSLDPDDDPAPGKMVLASPFMHHYIFEALRKHGREQAVLDIIRLRWGRWVEDGSPTTWENWNVDFPDGSICHAFSAHPRYRLAQIFGKA